MVAPVAIVVLLAICQVAGGAAQWLPLGWNLCFAAAVLTGWAVLAVKTPRAQRLRLHERLFVGALLLLPIVQLIPLPFAWWSTLPGHGLAARIAQAVGEAGPAPISLMPERTLFALLSLAAPIAAFLIVRRSSATRPLVAWTMVVFAALDALLAILQMEQGEASPLRIYANTDATSGVGLFSNPNHCSVMLTAAIPFASELGRDLRARHSKREAMIYVLCITFAALIGMGVLLAGSRAGFLFYAVALVYALLRLFPSDQRGRPRNSLAMLRMIAVGLVLLGSILAVVVAQRMGILQPHEGRLNLLPRFWRVIGEFFPFGSGLGTFDPVYRTYEQSGNFAMEYLNQAHNEPAQVLIEGGLFGGALLLWLVLWWGAASLAAARRAAMEPARWDFAAIVVTGFLLVHSLVDYPLRTSALAAIFGACFAMIRGGGGTARQTERR